MSSAAIAGSIAPACFLRRDFSASGAATSRNTIITMPSSAFGSSMASTRDIELVRRIAVHAKAVHLDRRALLDGPPQRDGELRSYGGPGHHMDIPVRLAGRGFEILSRVSADVEDVPEFVHQDSRRGEFLQQQLIRQHLQVRGRG